MSPRRASLHLLTKCPIRSELSRTITVSNRLVNWRKVLRTTLSDTVFPVCRSSAVCVSQPKRSLCEKSICYSQKDIQTRRSAAHPKRMGLACRGLSRDVPKACGLARPCVPVRTRPPRRRNEAATAPWTTAIPITQLRLRSRTTASGSYSRTRCVTPDLSCL